MEKVIYYLVCISWCLIMNTIGMILTNMFHFNLFDMYIYITLLSIYSCCSSLFLVICENSPITTIKKFLNLDRTKIFKIIFASFPIFMLNPLCFIDTDIVINQLINGSNIVFNLVYSVLMNKKYYLINYKIISLVCLNLLGCILTFIFDDFANIKIGYMGISLVIILLNIKGYIFGIIEEFDNMNEINMNEEIYTFGFIGMFIPQIIIYILMLPIFFIIQYYIYGYHLTFTHFCLINSFASIVGLFNGTFYQSVNKSIIKISSIDNAIVSNINMILSIFVAIALNYSKFNYIYIISFVIIIISAIYLVKYNKSELLPT